jgi:hypothetical protein|nr:MAG TPA: NinB protein [Caudoviricetes sp.]
MKIESARIMGNDLILTASIPDARRFVYGFKPGEYEISPAKKKRSLNANAYAWKLINDIALAVRESPEDVYREALKNIPNICEVLCVQDKAGDTLDAVLEYARSAAIPATVASVLRLYTSRGQMNIGFLSAKRR